MLNRYMRQYLPLVEGLQLGNQNEGLASRRPLAEKKKKKRKSELLDLIKLHTVYQSKNLKFKALS